MANAGRILILPKGEYNANTTYTMLDLVTYNGASWLAKKTATGITPSDANSSYWQKLIDVAGKQDTIKGGATTITDNNLTTNRALVSDGNGKVAVSVVTSTELGYLDGVTSNIQTQLNGKSASGHTHNYAGASTPGGSATSATKATQDSQGQQINTTYIKGVSASGNVITVTKGNGTSSNITIKAGDESTVRFVNNESDENFDWIQVKDANDEWINFQRAYTQRYELYVSQNNGAEFTAYAGGVDGYVTSAGGTPEVAFANAMTVTMTKSIADGFGIGCVISKPIDLSRFNKLKFYHESTLSNAYARITVFITQLKDKKMTPITSQILAQDTSANGNVEIDISGLNGEYYIGIETKKCGNSNASVTISNMYME